MKPYAGIGSRNASPEMLQFAERAAEALQAHGWTLRSGHAEGMDSAFAAGAGHRAEIYLPWPSFRYNRGVGDGAFLDADVIVDRPTREAFTLAEGFHPAWDACSDAAKKLHARNMHIICGRDLLTPVRFVICWTSDGSCDGVGSGGTHQALRCAHYFDIPVFNLARSEHRWRIERLIESYESYD